MPNPNAVVSGVLRVERDSIELGNQRRVRLDPERPDTRGLGPILDGLSKLRQPVYLEVDPATSAITRLLSRTSRTWRMSGRARMVWM